MDYLSVYPALIEQSATRTLYLRRILDTLRLIETETEVQTGALRLAFAKRTHRVHLAVRTCRIGLASAVQHVQKCIPV